jgi:hypothetical protein
MATQSAQFEPVAWWWTRKQIGRDLRELYEVSKEIPPKLLAMVQEVRGNRNQVSRARTLIGTLDAIEGQLMRHQLNPAA